MEIFGVQGCSAETGNNATHYINGTSGDSITMPTGGAKYSYFDTSTNMYKLPRWTGYQSSTWWSRSPSLNQSGYFCRVDIEGTYANINPATATRGLAPAFCL